MKKNLKILALVLLMSGTSFAAYKAVTPKEKKELELEKKYHLRKVSGRIPKNAKNFATLEQLEAYLENRRTKLENRRTKQVVKPTLNFLKPMAPLIGSSGSDQVIALGNNEYMARIEFVDLSEYGYPDLLDLRWDNPGNYVSGWLTSWAWTPAHPIIQSYSYSQESASRGVNTISIVGKYEETYSGGGGGYFIRTYDVEIWATFDESSISALIYIEDRWF